MEQTICRKMCLSVIVKNSVYFVEKGDIFDSQMHEGIVGVSGLKSRFTILL